MPDDLATPPTVLSLNAAVSSSATLSATLRLRTNLAVHHLFAACRFSAQIGHIERENAGQPLGDFWEEVLHYSLGVVTLTVASLESYANEHLADGALSAGALPSKASASIADLIDRESILKKFNLILELRRGEGLNYGENIVQCVDLLIKLRNAVIHFRPEWHDEDATHARLSAQLTRRFQRSSYFDNERLFPRAWASHSFSVWALNSAVSFLENFEQAAGLDSKINPFRARFSALSGGVV